MRICDQYKKQKQNYMDKTIKKMIIKYEYVCDFIIKDIYLSFLKDDRYTLLHKS
jgi:hypothetical protein